MMAKETYESRSAQRFIERLLEALEAQPMTRSEMQEILYASRSKAVNYIRHLHGDDNGIKRIFICEFSKGPRGGRVPRYAVGDLPDAVPPPALTFAERWEQVKATPSRHARKKAAAREQDRRKGIPPRRVAKPDAKLFFAALGL